jgi:AraC-like DNA-binding protein
MVRSSGLADFGRFAVANGLDPIALMKRAGIQRRFLDDPDLILPVRNVAELLEAAAMASGMEDFGLRLGEKRGLPDFGPVILMLREETTVRDALRTLVALLHLHTNAYYPQFDESAEPILSIDLMVGGPAYYRQAIEATVASLTQILRWLLGEGWVPASIHFVHARPAGRARHDRFFRCPVEFQQEFNAIALHARDLGRKLPASSPVLKRQVERFIRTVNVASNDAYVHQVTQIVAMALPRGEGRADTIARYLGTDRRTLHRRLARVGANFSGVLNDVRKNLTIQHLLGSNRSLADIAELTGFSSLSAFTHWFRDSFGNAPSVWRRSQRDKQK